MMSRMTRISRGGIASMMVVVAVPILARPELTTAAKGATSISVTQSHHAPIYPWQDNAPCVSDFASHYGIKCDEQSEDLLTAAQVSLRTSWGMPGYTLGEYSYQFSAAAGGAAAPPSSNRIQLTERHITYLPYGWKEEARTEGLKFSGETFFIGMDQLVRQVTVTCDSARAVTLVPILHFWGRPTVNRGRQPTPSLFKQVELGVDRTTNSVTLSMQGLVTATAGVCGPSGVRYWEYRVIRPGFALGQGVTFTRTQAEMDSFAYEVDLPGQPVTLQPKETRTFGTVIGLAKDDLPSAVQLADQGKALVTARKGWEALPAWVQAEWQSYFASLPTPHTRDPQHLRLFYQSATAVRMNLYGPISRMRATGSVPIKGFYDAFYAWDTGFQALGYTVVDPRLAEESLLVQFDAQLSDGCIPNVIGEDGGWSHEYGPLVAGFNDDTQAPVQGWAILQILQADHDRPRLMRFLQTAYPGLSRYVQWWKATRDLDQNGLVETSWRDDWDPNVSRYEFPHKTMAPLAYNGFLYACDEALEQMAGILGRPEEAARWRREEATLSHAIDTQMWDGQDRFWYPLYDDDTAKRTYRLDKLPYLEAAIIPAMGASADLNHVRGFIRANLLNPARFFGPHPMPSLAQDAKEYDPDMWWKGKLILIYAYPAIVTLYRYGYEQEAALAAKRILNLIAPNPEGIFETYNHATGKGDRCWQFSWSSHMLLLMLTESWQRERFLFNEDRSFSGHVKRAVVWKSRAPFLTIDTGAYSLPWIQVQSDDGKPLLQSHRLRLRVSNPYPDPRATSAELRLTGPGRYRVERIGAGERSAPISVVEEDGSERFSVRLPTGSQVQEYLLTR